MDIIPHAHFIIGTRDHKNWILSIYKHYLKYGGSLTIEEFLNSIGQDGFLSWKDLMFSPRIQLIQNLTGKKPFVYDMSSHFLKMNSFAKQLQNFICGDPCSSKSNTNFERTETRNEGVNLLQSKILQNLHKLELFKKVSSIERKSGLAQILTKCKFTPHAVIKIAKIIPSKKLFLVPREVELIKTKLSNDAFDVNQI